MRVILSVLILLPLAAGACQRTLLASDAEARCAALLWLKVDEVKSGTGVDLEPADYATAVQYLRILESLTGQAYGVVNRWAADATNLKFVLLDFARFLTGFEANVAYTGAARARAQAPIRELALRHALRELTHSTDCGFSQLVPDSNADGLGDARAKLATLRYVLRPGPE